MKATTPLCTESKEGKVDLHSFDFALVVTKQWQQDKGASNSDGLRKDLRPYYIASPLRPYYISSIEFAA
jgi:hypothetical protein